MIKADKQTKIEQHSLIFSESKLIVIIKLTFSTSIIQQKQHLKKNDRV